MISPTMIAPNSEPTNAPTIPPQKWSGRKIVKYQIARPIITQPSIPISVSPPSRDRSSGPSARPAVTTVARAPALLAPFGLVLEHKVLRREVRRGVAVLLGRLLGLGLDSGRALGDAGAGCAPGSSGAIRLPRRVRLRFCAGSTSSGSPATVVA